MGPSPIATPAPSKLELHEHTPLSMRFLYDKTSLGARKASVPWGTQRQGEAVAAPDLAAIGPEC
jgi:hypothetical protein